MDVGRHSSFEGLLEDWDGETAVIRRDRESGSWFFVCLHSTRLGPAGGGTRMKIYGTPTEALEDAMRLSAAMTRKLAVAGLPFGGGKAVLAVPEIPRGESRRALFLRYGDLVASLGGTYRTSSDINTNEHTIRNVRRSRSIAAAIILAATLAGSTWLYLYRVRSVARFIDERGYTYHAPYTMSVQPWWSVFAAVLLLAVGTAAVIWVMPDRSRILGRLRHVMSASESSSGSASPTRAVTGLALLAVGAVLTHIVRVTARAAHSLRVTHTLG
jgi:Glu/Leu/Phe/Val dehydrogenase, dimerisation domain